MARGVLTGIGTVMVLVAGLVARATDPTGVWIGEYRTNEGGVFEMTLTLKADGTALSGTLKQGSGEAVPIADGKVSDSTLTFSVSRTFQGRTQRTTYKAAVDGDEMKLTLVVGENSREFTLKRKK